jgi:hypothetical protein
MEIARYTENVRCGVVSNKELEELSMAQARLNEVKKMIAVIEGRR